MGKSSGHIFFLSFCIMSLINCPIQNSSSRQWRHQRDQTSLTLSCITNPCGGRLFGLGIILINNSSFACESLLLPSRPAVPSRPGNY